MKFGRNYYEWWNSNQLKIQDLCADSNLRPRCEASGISKDLPTLEPRVEARNETRNLPCAGERRVGSTTSSENPAATAHTFQSDLLTLLTYIFLRRLPCPHPLTPSPPRTRKGRLANNKRHNPPEYENSRLKLVTIKTARNWVGKM
ncbi:hypothetical protein AVEN_259942-1 [Araneus ventricosus]|uniref:Uncharacterized protein n=1 Tax=Araneus ventricosus TaxID=182803 RepID=A0A4Y2GMA3_ARAVE|nr:hypothetical protein AVEN_259942-1 [Araneus ventricosus]